MAAAAILENRKIVISRPTDFDQIWQGDAVWPSWAFRPLKFEKFKNPRRRRPPSWKIEKSPYLGRSSTDFDQIWHGNAGRPSWAFRLLNFQKFKNPRWRRPPSWKIEKSPYFGNGLTDCREILQDDACSPSTPSTVKVMNFYKSKMADGCHLEIR